MLFSDQIFEAIVVEIDYEEGTCSISPIQASTGSTISGVPIPHLAGSGNAGIFMGLSRGTRVLAMFTSAKSRDITVISGIIPKSNLYDKAFSVGKSEDTPSGTLPYPSIKDNEVIIRGNKGAQISLLDSGDISTLGVNGGGSYLKRNQARTAMTLAVEDLVTYTNGSRIVSGPVRRMSSIKRNLFPKPDLTQTPLFADPDYAVRTTPKGFFVGSKPLRRSYSVRKRNPEMSEYRMVINEFSTDYMFTGFDDEVKRATNSLGMYENSETYARNREQGSTLHLAEHELIEMIGGNVVDINGNVLDLNYNPLSYGVDNNKVPSRNLAINYDRARRISRRGIGWHWQLTTNTRTTDPSQTLSNLVFDVDKEGLMKINIPASSDTGNIPFVSNANFTGDNDGVEVTFQNQTSIEPIPVTLRDENGVAVFPGKDAQNYSFRQTGVRYSVGGESPYFQTEDGSVATEVRINTTKYHNIYAACERLIANTIRVINIPKRFTNKNGFPEGISTSKPFEIPLPNSANVGEGDPGFKDALGEDSTDFPTYMSTIAVEPGQPAIYSGGGEAGNGVGTLIAGKLYVNETDNPPYSNSFNSSSSGDEIRADIADGEEKVASVGGKSLHANLEGSIEMSVGKDNCDQKSIVLDTAGSIIAWLGKDKNNRSAIIQTDGDFLLNVGGSYEGTDLGEREMNKGRLEIRVNVTDKKFVSTQFVPGETPEGQGNPGPESDYLISISEKGLVIAGMKSEAPMILRNDGPVMIESSSSTVTLKGTEVRTVDPKGVISVIKPPTRN